MTTLLAHEWISTAGGSENVVEQIRQVAPADSRLVCLWNDDPERFPGAEESMLARAPFRGRKALSLPLMPRVWRTVSLDGVDRVVASSHAFAHHLAARAAEQGISSFAYIHSPARYIWEPELDGRGGSIAGRKIGSFLQRLDRSATSENVHLAANSHFVADRIRRCWDLPATVVYPPVDVERIQRHVKVRRLGSADQRVADRLPTEFILGASRLIPYKRLDSAVRVGELLDMPVVIAGSGPDEAAVRARADEARVPVTMLGRVTDELLHELYFRATLFVFMPIEDFGIMPVEAMAAGTPVLVNRYGGASETVRRAGAGAVASPDDDTELKAAATSAIQGPSGPALSIRAKEFSNDAFNGKMARWAFRPKTSGTVDESE